MAALRNTRSKWTSLQWKAAVKAHIVSQDWGIKGHGGYRHGKRKTARASASDDFAEVQTITPASGGVELEQQPATASAFVASIPKAASAFGGVMVMRKSAAASCDVASMRKAASVSDDASVMRKPASASGDVAVRRKPASTCSEVVVPMTPNGHNVKADSNAGMRPHALVESAEAALVTPDSNKTAATANTSQPNIEDVASDSAATAALPAALPAVPVMKKPRLAGYEVHSHIGGGTFADVYKATLKEPANLTVAVKLLHKQGQYVKQSQDHRRELEILKELKGHPHIIELIAWRVTHFNTQLIMHYYPMDLRKFIRERPVEESIAKVISTCLLKAVAYLQDNAILHRDIKPANILVKRQPLAAVLADFGAARHLLPKSGVDDQGLSTCVTTMWYRAPEDMIAPGKYGLPSDVWSVGITMVEMEEGKAPFQSSHEVGMLFKIAQQMGFPFTDDWRQFDLGPEGFVGAMGTCFLPVCPPRRDVLWGIRFGHAFLRLINDLLVVVPSKRMPAQEALNRSTWLEP